MKRSGGGSSQSGATVPLNQTINTQTASYVAALVDSGAIVRMNVATGNTFTIPPNSSVAFPVGTSIDVVQYGAGQVTITPGVGVTFRSDNARTKTAGRYARATVTQIAADEWVLAGDLTVLTVADSFDRPNSATTPGSADTGQTATVVTGTWGISNKQLYCATQTDGASVVWPAGNPLHVVSIVVAVLPSADACGVQARWSDALNYYQADVGTAGNLRLFKFVAGAPTSVGTAGNGSMVAGDTLTLDVSTAGVQLVKVNGVTKITGGDSAVPAGSFAGAVRGSGIPNILARWEDLAIVA